MIVHDAEQPLTSNGLYHLQYQEAVEGKHHAYKHGNTVVWTSRSLHPADPKCPECASPGRGTK